MERRSQAIARRHYLAAPLYLLALEGPEITRLPTFTGLPALPPCTLRYGNYPAPRVYWSLGSSSLHVKVRKLPRAPCLPRTSRPFLRTSRSFCRHISRPFHCTWRPFPRTSHPFPCAFPSRSGIRLVAPLSRPILQSTAKTAALRASEGK